MTASRPRKILIDTDPGIDDAMAILAAFASPDVEVVGLTSIFGNCPTWRSTANLAPLVAFADHVVPIGYGAETPVFGAAHPTAAFVHGEDGLGDAGHGVLLAPDRPSVPTVGSAANLIIETVRANPGEVTLLAIGPLTNLALALALAPDIVDDVAEVVIMGGALAVPGNASAMAEANIIHDPYAADLVLAAAWPTRLVSLDVTHDILLSADELERLGRDGGEAGAFLAAVSRFYLDFHRTTGVDGMHLHDPAALVAVIDPDAFTTVAAPVTVTIGGPANGQTVTDRRGGRSKKANGSGVNWSERPPVHYTVGVDADRVRTHFLDLFLGSN